MPETGLTFADFLEALPLFRDAILCGVVAGAALGYLSVLVVLRRMVFVTATLSQASGFGIALGLLVLGDGLSEAGSILSGLLVTLAAAAALAPDTTSIRMSREGVMAVLWLAASAGALLVGDRISAEAHDIAALLFGTGVLVHTADLVAVLIVAPAALIAVHAARDGLVFAGFDRDGARVRKVPVRLLELGWLLLLSLLVSVSTRALGALPVFAFAVLPGMTGLMAARTLAGAFPVALAAGAASALLGYSAAFFTDMPVGACQAATAALLAVAAMPIRRFLRSG